MSAVVGLPEIEAARARIAGMIRPTPVDPSPGLSERAGVPVWLKLEHLQHTGSFKLRGASNAVAQLDEATRARGVAAASTGNHGRALAHAARRAGARAVICMSALVPRNKVEAIEALGVAGFTVVGADMNPSTEVTSIDPGQRLALVLGAEGAGLSAQARSAIDATVGIAMAPLVESLNVAVTAGILMHSLAR